MVAATTAIRSEMAAHRLTPGSARDKVNVAKTERWLSLIGGSALALYGLSSKSLPGFGLAMMGGALAYRGLSGHCALYHALDISTKEHGEAAAVGAGRGFKIVHAVTIQRSPQELYARWHDFRNLPRFMNHLLAVQTDGDGNRSHWIARAPAGLRAEWDAEIVNDEPNRLIAWRSLTGSQIATAGSVHFTPLSNGRGTEMRVTLKYDPPGGKLASWFAWLFGEEPGQQIREDLRRFKQWMEAGEIATVQGQPRCR